MRVDLVSIRGAGLAGPSPSLLSQWHVGAILQAVAVRDAVSGQLWLDIGGHRYPARIASGSAVEEGPVDGEQLQLRVLRNSPVLALETLSSTRPSGAAAEATVVADALRRHVPRQESPAPMLANLAWLAQGKSGANELPKAVVQAAVRLWQALPEADALGDPKTLEAALTRSGTLLESNLSMGSRSVAAASVATDLKALMLSLNRTLRENGARPAAARADVTSHAPIPSVHGPLNSLPGSPATFALADAPAQQLNELSRQTEGALARLTTVQISNVASEPGALSMLFELPIRHEDRAGILRLRIERESSRQQQGESNAAWSVEAALDLGIIGALHARVTLQGHRVGVQLRAESAAVVDTLSAHAIELESILREAGLEVDRVVCLHGMPAGDAGVRPSRLLDVRA